VAREWKQWSDAAGEYVDWPANQLPNIETIFRAGFINQFLGWMRYVGNFVWEEYEYPLPVTIERGNVAQYLDLWNGIGKFDVLESPDFNENIWIEVEDLDDIKELEAEFDGDAKISDSIKYSDLLEESPLIVGDNLQAAIRGIARRARARLDMLKLWRNGRTKSYEPDEEPDSLHSWARYGDMVGTWTSEAYERWASALSNSPHSVPVSEISDFIYRGPNWCAGAYTNNFENVDSRFSYLTKNIMVVATERCAVAAPHGIIVTAQDTYETLGGLSSPPVPWEAGNPDCVFGIAEALGEEEKALDEEADWNYWPNQVSDDSPKRSFKGSGYYCFLEDELPEDYLPEGGFPWD